MKKIALILTAFLLSFSLAFAVVENLEVPPKQYTGNGVTTDFPITFDYSGESDLTVSFVNDSDGSIDAWTQDALGDQGYTIVNDEVIANTAPDNGRLVIDGETPLTQTLNLKNNRATPAELYESALDKGILATRDVKAVLDRTMTAPATADPDVDYTAPEYEAGSYWQWHPTLKELRNAAISGSTITVGTDVGDIVELVDDGFGIGVFPITTFPVATTSDSGIVELATDTESIAGTSTEKVVTPSNLTRIGVFYEPQRAKFVYGDTDTITIEPAVYRHQGTTTQFVYWDADLSYDFVSLGVSDWSYLYLDDSDIVTADTNVITASELIDLTTGPTWSDVKKGWYNGEDRCIFAVFTNGSSEIVEFLHTDNLVQFGNGITIVSGSTPGDTWTDANLTIPIFSEQALTTLYGEFIDTSEIGVWRTNLQTGAGHVWCKVTSASQVASVVLPIITDSAGIIEVRWTTASGNEISVYTDGWYFPIGM